MVRELLSDRTEANGLLALMLLHHSRRDARETPSGDLVLLEEQDRHQWNEAEIREGVALVRSAGAASGAGGGHPPARLPCGGGARAPRAAHHRAPPSAR